jgi:serine/threonine protein kinase
MDVSSSSHPSDDALRAYGLGKLDDGRAGRVGTHLDRCPDCQKRVAELSADGFLKGVRDTVRAADGVAPRPPVPPGAGATEGGRPGLPPGLADHPDYRITRELGRGGMGVVFLAQNTLMGRDVVLKVIGHQLTERPGVVERFLREIRAVAKLRHPNIVAAYHASRLGDGIVFEMEYVPGLDLARVVKAKGPLPVSVACHFARQAALGLQHAYEQGVVHRDVKPSNLMLSRQAGKSVVKVLDFGLAKGISDDRVDSALTWEGQALGTPDFIAPEQITDAPGADVRADVYSLGATLYYLLTGRPPFEAGSVYDLYQAHISREPAPLTLARPEVPAALAAVVARMMAKSPARRYQTPGEVALALEPFCKGGRAPAPSPEFEGVEVLETGGGPTDADAGAGSPPSDGAPADEPDATPSALMPRSPQAPGRSGVGVRALLSAVATRDGRGGVDRSSKALGVAVAVGVALIGLVMMIVNDVRAGRRKAESPARTAAGRQKLAGPAATPPARPVATVSSRFARGDDEGWTTVNRNGTKRATFPVVVETDGTNWWLSAKDHSNSKAWGWKAPPKFLGNQSDKFGKFLNYAIRVNHSHALGGSPSACYVRLKSRDAEVFIDRLPLRRLAPGRWTAFSVKLDGAGRWVTPGKDGLPTPATDADVKRVLADLTELWIKGEYYGHGPDVGNLDDVELGAESPSSAAFADGSGTARAHPGQPHGEEAGR